MDETLSYFCQLLKNSTFRGEGGGGSRKTNLKGGLPKKGGVGQFANLRGDRPGKKEGVVFFGGLIPQCKL